MKAKKITVLAVVFSLFLGMLDLPVFAAAASASVRVTIANAGSLVMTEEPVTVTDTDKDGALTINDALILAHDAKYPDGAAAGYASAKTQYGLGITKLWGDTSGNFGYYVDNKSSNSLADPVKDGDTVYAFVYSDAVNYSDAYSYFDLDAVTAKAGENFALTLSSAGFDANWNPVTKPVAGAIILVDGAETAYTTDAEGKVSVQIGDAGSHLISARSEDKSVILVPPVCTVTVSAVTVSTSTVSTSTVNAVPADPAAVNTGDSSGILLLSAAGIASLAAAAWLMLRRRKSYEK